MNNKETRCGFIAIIGKPNVGKSTLLNRILGEKVSITSKKPQTTRHKILGIKTKDDKQLIFVDTPGLHKAPKHTINHLMIRSALRAIKDVDVIVFVIDALRWRSEDEMILRRLSKSQCPIFIVMNKIDTIKDKKELLPLIETITASLKTNNIAANNIIPVSAKTGDGVEELENELGNLLAISPFYFESNQSTDRNDSFVASELIREKLIRVLGQEIPYVLGVGIEEFKMEKGILKIRAMIWVEKKGQKVIVIGKGGAVLKEVGRLARIDMENQFKEKVFLTLWVKVKEGWTDDKHTLLSLGYGV